MTMLLCSATNWPGCVRACLGLLAVGSIASTSQAQLLGHWKFDEAAGASTAVDDLGLNDGVIDTANVTTGVTGVSGNAYSFSGVDNDVPPVDMGRTEFLSLIDGVASGDFNNDTTVDAGDYTLWRNNLAAGGGDQTYDPNPGSIDPEDYTTWSGGYGSTQAGSLANEDVTFSYWVNVPSDAAVVGGTAVYAGRDSTGNVHLSSGLSDDYTLLEQRDNSTGVLVATNPTDPLTLNDGEWRHVVFVVDADTGQQVYVDNVLVAEQQTPRSSNTTGSPQNGAYGRFVIGDRHRGTPIDYFFGSIDDVQVYADALTSDDVSFLFNNPGMALGGGAAVAAPEPSAMVLGLTAIALLPARRR